MKKILLLTFIAWTTITKAQITLEHIYDTASVFSTQQMLIVNFEVSGPRYVKVNRAAKTICIYDLSHSLVKTISLATVPLDAQTTQISDILYFSEQLFNTDTKVEFMYCYQADNNNNYMTNIYNENATLLFSDTSFPAIRTNVPLQQYPIYNTPNGTKMILSCYNKRTARVFSLPGTLTTAIELANQNLVQARGLISNPHPNPTSQSTNIEYNLPDNINQGEIVFYDQQGTEIKRFKVDKTFNSLLISTTDIPAGTYYYQLQTGGDTSAGKKLVVIK